MGRLITPNAVDAQAEADAQKDIGEDEEYGTVENPDTYPIDVDEEARIEKEFSYHSPNAHQIARYQAIREYAKDFRKYITKHAPPSRELSVAKTKLEEVVFWTNAAIARNEINPN